MKRVKNQEFHNPVPLDFGLSRFAHAGCYEEVGSLAGLQEHSHNIRDAKNITATFRCLTALKEKRQWESEVDFVH